MRSPSNSFLNSNYLIYSIYSDICPNDGFLNQLADLDNELRRERQYSYSLIHWNKISSKKSFLCFSFNSLSIFFTIYTSTTDSLKPKKKSTTQQRKVTTFLLSKCVLSLIQIIFRHISSQPYERIAPKDCLLRYFWKRFCIYLIPFHLLIHQ